MLQSPALGLRKGSNQEASITSSAPGVHSIADYAVEFCTFATESTWNSDVSLDALHHGPSEEIKDEEASWEVFSSHTW